MRIHLKDKSRLGEWHSWFAWYPVILDDHRFFVWMEHVLRRVEAHRDYDTQSYWFTIHYRLK